METASDVFFFVVFFAPVGLMVVLNLLMHSTPVALVAPWAQFARPAQPVAQPAADPAQVTNDALEREAA